jgi:hypothetical protein
VKTLFGAIAAIDDAEVAPPTLAHRPTVEARALHAARVNIALSIDAQPHLPVAILTTDGVTRHHPLVGRDHPGTVAVTSNANAQQHPAIAINRDMPLATARLSDGAVLHRIEALVISILLLTAICAHAAAVAIVDLLRARSPNTGRFSTLCLHPQCSGHVTSGAHTATLFLLRILPLMFQILVPQNVCWFLAGRGRGRRRVCGLPPVVRQTSSECFFQAPQS